MFSIYGFQLMYLFVKKIFMQNLRWVICEITSYLSWIVSLFDRMWSKSYYVMASFQTAVLRIPFGLCLGTSCIEKVIFMISASIFSEYVWGMELKFSEEIEQHLIFQKPSPYRRDFCGLALIPVWGGGSRCWRPLVFFSSLNSLRPKVIPWKTLQTAHEG